MKVAAFILAHDQDLWIEHVIANVLPAVDMAIVLHHRSSDGTEQAINRGARTHPCPTVSKTYDELATAHRYVEGFAGQDLWAWQIDGDELYDTAGLCKLADACRAGEFDDAWRIHGRYLHATQIEDGRITGHLHQGKCGANFYNMSHLEAWPADGKRFAFMADTLRFKPGRNPRARDLTHERAEWDASWMRCIHTRFLPQSSSERPEDVGARLSPQQVMGWGLKHSETGGVEGRNERRSYRSGPVVTVDGRPFLTPQGSEVPA